MTQVLKFLAFDTSTDMMSVALSQGDQTWHHHGVGGANASAQLIPTVHALLAQAQLQLSDLTALVVGQGPGSFTGLRTACAVAQGLALGANLKVIPVDSLKAVAEDARHSLAHAQDGYIASVMDARMGEVYVGVYAWHAATSQWTSVQPLQVGQPEAMAAQLSRMNLPKLVLAGNGMQVYKDRFLLQEFEVGGVPVTCVAAVPNALALLRLAPGLWAKQEAVAPEWVQPLYIRDKVAQTTAERDAIKLAKADALATSSASTTSSPST
ncbi:MAG: tRNA threonylcarbamoyladenosine biosynthesis protein TsaB [Pseudomonadota bacterium]